MLVFFFYAIGIYLLNNLLHTKRANQSVFDGKNTLHRVLYHILFSRTFTEIFNKN